MQKTFDELIQLLPTNSYFIACQLKNHSKFTDVFIDNDEVLSKCEDHHVVNECLLWYMYRKCDYNVEKFTHDIERIFISQNILPSTVKYLEHTKG